MVSLDSILDEVMIILPGATLATIRLVIKSVVKEFFVVSGSWIEELDPIDIEADTVDYNLEPFTAIVEEEEVITKVVQYIYGIAVTNNVNDATSRYKWIPAITTMQLRARDKTATCAVPQMYAGYADEPAKFTIYPKPTALVTDGMVALVALNITTGTWDGTIPAMTLRQHRETLIDGTLAAMYSHAQKPYTNMQQSLYYKTRFRSGMMRAREMSRRQYTKAETPVTFPAWA